MADGEAKGLLLFLVLRIGYVAGGCKGTPSTSRGGLSLLVQFSTRAAAPLFSLLEDGADSVPEQKSDDDGDKDIGKYGDKLNHMYLTL